jgi:hypothetical protein
MNAAAPPPEPPAAAPAKSSLLSRGRAVVLGISATLAALVAIIANWNSLTESLFPAKAATAATIVARVESDISLPEYEVQSQGSASITPAAPALSRARYRFADHTTPESDQPAVAPVLLASLEPPGKGTQPTTTNSTEQKQAEVRSVTEEAKHAEERATTEKAQATAERKSAEAHEQEEQTKETKAKKRAEEASTSDAPVAEAEATRARSKVVKARETVRAKKQEAIRPRSQRRIESGTPASQVEEVLHKTQLPHAGSSTCGLKPIVESALKSASNDAAAAAKELEAVNPGAGARVHYNIMLKGLEGKVVKLVYSLVQTDGSAPPEPYEKLVTIRTVAPKGESEPVKGVCWVAVPSTSRRYFLDLTVYDGKTEVESGETKRFW